MLGSKAKTSRRAQVEGDGHWNPSPGVRRVSSPGAWGPIAGIANIVMAVTTAAAAVGAMLSAKAARDTVRAQLRPLVVVHRASPPTGLQFTASGVMHGEFHFKLHNAGPGPAVLGQDPFRETSFPTTENPTGVRMVEVAGRRISAVLAHDEHDDVDIRLGFWGGNVLKDPFEFNIHYKDVQEQDCLTTVRVRPKTGEICGLTATYLAQYENARPAGQPKRPRVRPRRRIQRPNLPV